MKIKKLIPVFCLALGLTLTVPMTAGATGSTENTQQATTGWSQDNTYFVKEDGTKATGICIIDGTYYYFDSNGTLVKGQQGPVNIGKTLYFVQTNGTLLRNGWGVANNKKYYATDSAKLYVYTAARIGSQGIFCFDENGAVMTNGLKTIGNNTYLVDSQGRAYTNARRYNGKQYFFSANGTMRTGLIKYKSGSKNYLYYADPKTGASRTGWFKVGGKTYYANSKGRLKTGWQKYKGKRYYFNPKTGAMQSGWMKSGSKYYYYTTKGKMKTGWFTVKDKTYYAPKSGSGKGARVTGFQWISGKRYLFNTRGVLMKGWVTRSGNKYYVSSKGVVSTGWMKIKGKWYFFQNSGAMQTGWLVHNGQFYYLDPKTGAMVTGKKKIDGNSYKFNSNGTYTNGSLSGSWTIKVNRAANVVTVYKGTTPVKAFLCSTGLNNATPLGTFRIMDKLYTHTLNGPTYGYYCSHITSDILFHSIPAPTTARSGVPSYKFNMFGQQASEGCIRLAMGDAYWLYTTCPIGTTVVVYDDARNPGPLGKPTALKMATNPTYAYDPTDPDRTSRRSPK